VKEAGGQVSFGESSRQGELSPNERGSEERLSRSPRERRRTEIDLSVGGIRLVKGELSTSVGCGYFWGPSEGEKVGIHGIEMRFLLSECVYFSLSFSHRFLFHLNKEVVVSSCICYYTKQSYDEEDYWIRVRLRRLRLPPRKETGPARAGRRTSSSRSSYRPALRRPAGQRGRRSVSLVKEESALIRYSSHINNSLSLCVDGVVIVTRNTYHNIDRDSI